MIKITYIEFDGTSHTVEAPTDTTLMETAINNDVPGIVAECGGTCACATCHVYVAPEWTSKTGQPAPQEDGMLECVMDRHDNSRLSCQIELTDDMDGMVVRLPESQL